MIAKDSQSYRPSIDVFDPDSRQPLNPPTGFSGVRDIRQQNIGVYFQDQARIYDNWIVTLGAHYDWVDSKTEDKLAGTTSENDDKAFTWRAGLLYHFDNGIAPYFSYATSFEPVTGTNLFGERFEPTTGQQYEIGAKFQPPGSDALFSVAVFDLRQQNVRTTDPENAQNQIQTGEVRSRGIELEANAGFDFGLDLTAAVTLLDVDITESTEGVEGNTPTRVIEESVSVYGDYTLQRGPLSGSNSNFDPQPTGAAGQMLADPVQQHRARVTDVSDWWDGRTRQLAVALGSTT